MARKATRLPTDVVRCFLEHLKLGTREYGFETFLNALRVCKTWREQGESLLYADLALDPEQLIKFAGSFPSGHKSTRTLTIYIAAINLRKQRGLKSDGRWTRPDFDSLSWAAEFVSMIEKLPRIVNGMMRLESLSVVVPLGALVDFEIIEAMEKVLPALLREMPAAVKHLEVDAAGFVRRHNSLPSDGHLCRALRDRLPSLCNLRLRVRHLCKEVFQGTPSATTTDKGSDHQFAPVERGTIIINATNYDFDGTKQTATFSKEKLDKLISPEKVRSLVLTAQSAIASNNLGDLQRLSFFAVEDRDLGPKEYPAINEVVVVPSPKVLRYPYERMDGNERFLPLQRCYMRYKRANGSDAQACGSWSDCMNLAEGQVWIQTSNGYRVPSVYFRTEGRFKDSELQIPALMSDAKMDTRVMGTLREKETAKGRLLLVVRESNGFSDPAVVTRDLTYEEVKAAMEPHDEAAQPSAYGPGSIYLGSDDEDIDISDEWEEVLDDPGSEDHNDHNDHHGQHQQDEEDQNHDRYMDENEDDLRHIYLGQEHH